MFVIAGWDESGAPRTVRVQWCWRCGLAVSVDLVSMEEHLDRWHPVPEAEAVEPPRHRLGAPRPD